MEKLYERFSRRDWIKGLATIPVLGALVYGGLSKHKQNKRLKQNVLKELDIFSDVPTNQHNVDKSSKIKIGIIGYGIRGAQLMRALGFAHPTWIEGLKEANRKNVQDKRHEQFLEQENLNVEIKAVCDIFDVFAQKGIEAGANLHREGLNGKYAKQPIRYKTYKELIADPDIDAVVIASPDHWHAPMAIEAAKYGKHVYIEKPMTWTVPETYEIRDIVEKSGIVFQLGHQGRQTASYVKAKEIIEKNVLGKITLIETTTNRNTPSGAWQYDIHPDASQNNIDWQQFLGQAPYHPFSLERFFRWRCWWDYSTGLNGDLLTHEYDAINQILNLGIPSSVASSGGIYFFKDGRTVPDVLQVACEFNEKELTFLYSASLASSNKRKRTIMGHDASMSLGNTLSIQADRNSTRYKEKIKKGIIDTKYPIYSYAPGQKNLDAITSATEKYFADRGLLFTYVQGKRVDTTHLHMKEWINCIRLNKQPSCDIHQGFEEAIASHMATLSYREKRTMFWDKKNEKIV